MNSVKSAGDDIQKVVVGVIGRFAIRLIREGQRYGAGQCLLWSRAEPGIEFQLHEDLNGKPYPEPMCVARYYYTSLKFSRTARRFGLCLDGRCASERTLTAVQMREAIKLVDTEVNKFADKADIQRWRSSWHISEREK